MFKKISSLALTGAAHLVESLPARLRPRVSFAVRARAGLQAWLVGARAGGGPLMFCSDMGVSLHLSPSLPLSLKINKIFKGKKKEYQAYYPKNILGGKSKKLLPTFLPFIRHELIKIPKASFFFYYP